MMTVISGDVTKEKVDRFMTASSALGDIFELEKLHFDLSRRIWACFQSKNNIELHFSLDGGAALAEFVFLDLPPLRPNQPESGRTFSLNLVFDAIGGPKLRSFAHMKSNYEDGFFDMVQEYSRAIKENWPLISLALDGERRLQAVRAMDESQTLSSTRMQLWRLTDNGQFHIVKTDYGWAGLESNQMILQPKRGPQVHIKSRPGKVSVQLSIPQRPETPLPLNEILEAIGGNIFPYWDTTIDAASKVIQDNWNRVVEALNDRNLAKTLEKMARLRSSSPRQVPPEDELHL